MIIEKEFAEVINDLIDNRIATCDDITNLLSDVFRYGFDGYINISKDALAREALKKQIYGSDVKEIIIK